MHRRRPAVRVARPAGWSARPRSFGLSLGFVIGEKSELLGDLVGDPRVFGAPLTPNSLFNL